MKIPANVTVDELAAIMNGQIFAMRQYAAADALPKAAEADVLADISIGTLRPNDGARPSRRPLE